MDTTTILPATSFPYDYPPPPLSSKLKRCFLPSVAKPPNYNYKCYCLSSKIPPNNSANRLLVKVSSCSYAKSSLFDDWSQLLQSSIGSGDFTTGQSIHGFLAKLGIQNDTFPGNNLINLYAKFNRMDYAQSVFDQMLERNTITWTSLINGYSLVKDVESVLRIACEMYRLREEFNEHTWSVILRGCQYPDDWIFGEQVHCVLIKSGFCEDVVVATSLMSMYSRSGCWEDLEKLFSDLTCRDVRCFNLMISEYGRVGYSERAIQVFLELLNLGLEPDYYTLTNILSACNGERDMDLGRQLHGLSVKHGCLGKTSVGNAIITMYGKHGLVDEAERMFYEMDNKNLVSWTAMLSVYVKNGNHDKNTRGFTKIMKLGIHPDSSCLDTVLDGCSETKNLVLGLQIHGIILKHGLLSDVSVGTALVDIYTKCGKLGDARLVLNTTDTLNIASFNAILAGFTMREDAMVLFNELRKAGIEPDSVTFARLFSLCADQAYLGRGKSLHAFTIKTGFIADNKVGNAAITMYAKCGKIQELFPSVRLYETRSA